MPEDGTDARRLPGGDGSRPSDSRPILWLQRVMTIEETAAGTPVVDFSPEEYDAYLGAEVQRAVGMTVDEFVRSYSAGDLDDADPAVAELIGLLRIGQNGHRHSA